MSNLWTKYGTVPNLIDAWFRREQHERASAEKARAEEEAKARAKKKKKTTLPPTVKDGGSRHAV